ncbi:MAG: nitroreductase family protein [Elusimicrobiota bacterium]|jgi:predicted oxidoreductase (fatty acid repression mutant protein)|nr:nitroreductase family protein [Elusimicrobiota bacterium]
MDFFEAVTTRRSRYALSAKSTISDDKLKEIIATAVLNAPSAYNAQPARVVVLLGQSHKKIWDIAMAALRKIVPADKFARTENKINSFAAAYGTVLFYNDEDTIKDLQTKYPDYKDNFALWAAQGMGLVQYGLWLALTAQGLGANLQHYNPLIDEEAAKAFNIPPGWKLLGQMPFGVPAAPPFKKTSKPAEELVKMLK